MKRINGREVELTEGEQVLKEIVAGLTEDEDTRVLDLLTEIRDQVPLNGKVFALLSNADFCLYLADIRHQCRTEMPTDLEFLGVIGAPGHGQSWQCRECKAPWVKVGDDWYRPDEQDDDAEPPWMLTPEDVR